MENIKDRLKNLNQLDKDQQLNLRNDIFRRRPELLFPWHWSQSCEINILIVTDGALNFGTGLFGLSNFLTIFKKMEAESRTNIKYKVTLGHRNSPNEEAMQNSNPDFVKKFVNFRFDNASHFSPTKYDQVWLFGFNNSPLTSTEVNKIEEYMNKGGGLFATGDHGAIGRGLCGNIPRVRDMRHWQDFGDGEVSMSGSRRNDTNTPHSGNVSSTQFNDQADSIPQNIHARLYGTAPNLLPHYLLSINKNIKSSGIIDIMPDHPHEGECKPETNFAVINPRTRRIHTIRTQNIAMSFVPGGNTGSFKNPTDAHCFASISVFDGRSANVGRIVIDSTWHHFVNINLDGFTASTYRVIEQYYKNIVRWMTRQQFLICGYTRLIPNIIFSERIMEANTLDPNIKSKAIPMDELYAIGVHALDIVENEFTPADAIQFAITMLEPTAPELAKKLSIWDFNRDNGQDHSFNKYLNEFPIIATSLGMGIIKVKEKLGEPKERLTEKDEILIKNALGEGIKLGLDKSFKSFETTLSSFKELKNTVDKEYFVEGTITDSKGLPVSGFSVKAVDIDFIGENVLGDQVVSDKKGYYKISYKYSDFVIKEKESGGADIVLYITDKKGNLIHKTRIHKNSPKTIKIDVSLKNKN